MVCPQVRLRPLVVSGPLPDPDPAGAVTDGGVHVQPLRGELLRDYFTQQIVCPTVMVFLPVTSPSNARLMVLAEISEPIRRLTSILDERGYSRDPPESTHVEECYRRTFSRACSKGGSSIVTVFQTMVVSMSKYP